MRSVSRRRLAQTVVSLLHERPSSRRHTVQALAAYLLAHKQEKFADLLLLDISRELARTGGHVYAEITSAFPLDTAARNELSAYLQRAAAAKTVELDERIDHELLTGVVVRTADQELDTSARTKLNRLRSLNVNTPRET